MTASPARLSTIQNCYIVPNLDAACAQFHKMYGIGPFVGGTPAILDSHVYRGKPAPPIEIRGVFVQSGDLNIELLELVSTTPSAFHDMFPNGAGGFHHIAMFCPDYDRQKAIFIEEGFEIASEFVVPFGARICYVDARKTLGHMIELYPESSVIREMFRQARDAPNGWDGKTLIRPWDPIA